MWIVAPRFFSAGFYKGEGGVEASNSKHNLCSDLITDFLHKSPNAKKNTLEGTYRYMEKVLLGKPLLEV